MRSSRTTRRRAAWIALALLAASCGAPHDPRPSAILITLDTTRADALGCYGGTTPTPHLDRIAGEGVLYESARTTAPLTLPAHASMMTGLYPVRHSVRDNSLTPLPESARTLAEAAAEAGYETAAFVAAAVLDRGLGMAQGFDVYDQPARPQRTSVTTHFQERNAAQVVAAVRSWLAERDPERPCLLWVHFFDPHLPYAPPGFRGGEGGYTAEVAYMDAAIGELRAALEEDGWLDRSLVVVVGDHGEGLGDHGESTHGTLCYDSTLRVPFLVRYPDGHRAGERSAEITSVVDVLPTVAEALSLPVPETIDGRSLYRRRVDDDRGVYFETYYGYLQYGMSPIVGYADARAKLLFGPEAELRETTPDEPIADADADELERYLRAVREVAARERLAPAGAVDETLLSRLRALGYSTSGGAAREFPEPLEPTGLPDIRKRRAQLEWVYDALGLAEAGRYEEAITILRRVVRRNDRNAHARDWLATYLIHVGRLDEAIPVLEAMLEDGMERASVHNNLGHCRLEGGDAERAFAHFRRAHELDPSNPMIPPNVALALEKLGRKEEARRFLEETRTRSDPR